MIQKIFFIFLCFGLFVNQAGRIDLQNDIAFTVLDISVILFCLVSVIFHWSYVKQKLTHLPKAVLFFIFFTFLSAIWNIHNYNLFQNSVAFLYFLRFCLYTFFALAAGSMLQNKKNQAFVIVSLLATDIAILATGFLQYIFYSNLRNLYYLGWDDHLYRLFSTFFDPNFAAAFFVLFFLFLGGLFFSSFVKERIYIKVLIALLMCITLVALFLTFSRSGLIMLFCGSLVFLWLQKKVRYLFIILLILIAAFIIVAPKLSIENTNYFRIASTEARLNTAATAVTIIQRNPFFGVGFDAYRYAQEHYGFRQEISRSGAISHADAGTDNSFLFVWATTGIFGLASYFLALFSFLRKTYHVRRHVFSAVFFASLIAVMIDSLFNNALFYPSILLWLGVIYQFKD